MGVTTTTFGPLPPFAPLREARQKHADYEIEDAELHAAEQADSRAAFERVVSAGVGAVTIGSSAPEWLCRWAVPVTSGVEATGPVRPWAGRWQERALIQAAPEADGSWLGSFRAQAAAAGAGVLRAILPGAHYWMDVSFDEHHQSRAACCEALAGRIAAEVAALAAEGVKAFQLDELALGHRPGEHGLARAALDTVAAAAGGGELWLGVGALDGAVLSAVKDWPVTGVAVDVSQPGLDLAPLGGLGDLRILAGVGGEHGDADSIAERVARLREQIGDERLILSTGAGFEYLESDEAGKRLERLIQAAG
ncbi:hypothetical protein ABI59_09690 [Acidobacteria bacterium Mor1]|nr:hypothetical protein ABI59_09690 [Acidobacteria bacterium Mor1]